MESNVRRPIPSSAAQKGDKVANESNAQVEGDREEDATRMVIPLHFDRSNQQYSIVIEGADEQPPVEGSRESSADGDAPQTIPVHIGKRKQQYRLIFGLRGGHSQPRPPVSADPYDDSEATRYSYDKVGEELAPSARFYKAYNDKAVDFDAEVMEEYRDSIDVLPVFAGLFSAVVTTFVVQTSQNLQTNYAQLSTILLAELIAIQRASSNGTSTNSIPSSSINANVPSNLDIWINSLWFISLLLSLTTALIAVLAKQWLHHYTSMTSGTAQERARIRHFRYVGLQKWQVPTIISLLPVLLHLSLAIFVVGVVLFLHSLQLAITYAIGFGAGMLCIAYLCANLLPVVFPQCPYQTPFCAYGHLVYRLVRSRWRGAVNWSVKRWRKLRNLPLVDKLDDDSNIELSLYMSSSTNRNDFSNMELPSSSLKAVERVAVARAADELDIGCITWLYTASSSAALKQIAIQSISGLRADFPSDLTKDNLNIDAITRDLEVEIGDLHLSSGTDIPCGQEQKLDMLWRAILHLEKANPRLVDVFPKPCYVGFSSYADTLAQAKPVWPFQMSVSVATTCMSEYSIDAYNLLIVCLSDSMKSLKLPPFVWVCLLRKASQMPGETLTSTTLDILEVLHNSRLFIWGPPPKSAPSTHFSAPNAEMAAAMFDFLHAAVDFSESVQGRLPNHIPSQLRLLLRLVAFALDPGGPTTPGSRRCPFGSKLSIRLGSLLVKCFDQYLTRHARDSVYPLAHRKKIRELEMIHNALIALADSDLLFYVSLQEGLDMRLGLLRMLTNLNPDPRRRLHDLYTVIDIPGRSFSPSTLFARNMIRTLLVIPPSDNNDRSDGDLLLLWLSSELQSNNFYRAFREENVLRDICQIISEYPVWQTTLHTYLTTIIASDSFLDPKERGWQLDYIHLPENLCTVSQVLLDGGRADLLISLASLCYENYELVWRNCVQRLLRHSSNRSIIKRLPEETVQVADNPGLRDLFQELGLDLQRH